MRKCTKCGADIIFIQIPKSKKFMPCDEGLVRYKQDPAGKDTVITDKGEIIRCRFDFEGLPTGLARVPHWKTCPFADQYRRP